MTSKEEFISTLKSSNPSNDLKQECLQYFVENFPVFIKQVIDTPIGRIDTGQGFWTSLPNYKVKDDKIAMSKLEENYQKIVKRVDELETFK